MGIFSQKFQHRYKRDVDIENKSHTLNFVGHTDTGSRDHNEDSYAIVELDGSLLMIVADGLGGHNAGEVASELAVVEIQETVQRLLHATSDYRRILEASIEKANKEIFTLGKTDSTCAGMATTAVLALIDGEKAHLVNVGDSRAYLVNDSGIKQITKDQSLVQSLLDMGAIDEDEIFDHTQKNVVLQSLGNKEHVTPDSFEIKLEPNDILLFCSDGLTDILRDDEILSVVKRCVDFDSTPGELVNAVIEKGAKDNITIVMCKIGDEEA